MDRTFQRREDTPERERSAPSAPAPVVSPQLAWLARQPVAQRATVLHALSRTAGNQAVARAVLARDTADGAGGAAPRSSGGGGGPENARIDISAATPAERLAEIPNAIQTGDARYVADLWESFGDVRALATEHPTLFVESANLATYLWDHCKEEQEAFQRAVEGKALEHLSANRDYVAGEMQRLGVADGPASKRTPEQAEAIKETQGLTEKAQAALLYKQQLLGITVAVSHAFNGDEEVVMPVTFDPAKPVTPGQLDEPGDKTWDDVNRMYRVNEQLLANLQATSPAVFAMTAGSDLGHATNAAGDLATADPASAAAYLDEALSGLMHKLEEAAGDVGGKYSWDELTMLHGQVLAAPPFDDAIKAGAARQLIGGKAAVKEAKDAALTGVSVVAALFGIFATGGMAAALAAVGAAASGAQAVRSIHDYTTLAGLRQARTGDATHDLVDAETVDAAKAQAILDTVFAFLDTLAAAHAVAALGGKAGVTEKLGKYAELPVAAKAEVLGAAMETMDVPQALDRVGGINAVRGELAGTPAARRAEAYSKAFAAELGQRLGRTVEQVSEALPPRSAEELIAEARQYAATKTGLPAERALETICPQVSDPAVLAAMAESAAATAQEASEEYVKLGTVEKRVEKMHLRTVAAAAGRGLPEPGMKIGTTNHFEASSWSIVYDGRALEPAGVTNARWEELLSLGAGHELQHSHQWIEMGRYYMGAEGVDARVAALALGYDAEKGGAAMSKLGPITEGSAGFEQAREWYTSVFGELGEARNATLAQLPKYAAMSDANARAFRLARDIGNEFVAAQAAGRPEAELAQIRARLRRADQIAERIEARLEPLEEEFEKYRNLPEEVNARDAHDQIRKADANRREAEKLKAEVDRLQAEADASALANVPEPEPAPTWDIDDEDTVRDIENDPLLQRR